MKAELLAYMTSGGHIFAKIEGEIYRLHPPFGPAHSTLMSEKKYIATMASGQNDSFWASGGTVCNTEFDSIHDMIDFLSKEIVRVNGPVKVRTEEEMEAFRQWAIEQGLVTEEKLEAIRLEAMKEMTEDEVPIDDKWQIFIHGE